MALTRTNYSNGSPQRGLVRSRRTDAYGYGYTLNDAYFSLLIHSRENRLNASCL